MPTAGKLGKLPVDPTKPKLKLSTLLPDVAAAPVPDVVDYVSAVSVWPMYLNDRYGCCVESGSGHALQAQTAYGLGAVDTVTDDVIAQMYHEITGWDPNDPSSDQGTVVQDALSYWRKTGIDGHKIVAFATVNMRNADEVAAALYYFGHLLIGFEVHQAAMDQFEAGEPWDVTQHEGAYLGGHCVNVGLNARTLKQKKAITWARVQDVTDAFLDKYCDEMWVIVTRDWINQVTGATPAGMDLAAFGAEYAQLTGEQNPFRDEPPGPAPTPPPAPEPVPPVAPSVDDADRALAPFLHRISKHPFHHITHEDHAAITAWLSDKEL